MSANAFADVSDLLFAPDTTMPNACVFQNIGTYDESVIMIPIYEDIMYTCDAGYYLPANGTQCIPCQQNTYCEGGNFAYNETQAQGAANCPDGLVTPSGAKTIGDCGRILHIGAISIYLTQEKQTYPALAVKTSDGIFYAKLAPISDNDTPTTKSLKIMVNGIRYRAYDNTTIQF